MEGEEKSMESVSMNNWKDILLEEFTQPYWWKLSKFLDKERGECQIFPSELDTFRAFLSTPYEKVKVVILGQDPYHGDGEAHGLCFSVKHGVRIPPSLKNIYKELNNDLGITIPEHGCLMEWAKQGVLLLNSVLTVRKDSPGSHSNKGWEIFTDTVIQNLNDNKEHLVFILWGNYAKKKGQIIDREKHLVIESAHPSPFSATKFFGTKPFSRTNAYLASHNISAINWERL